jgi:hypothetical protein
VLGIGITASGAAFVGQPVSPSWARSGRAAGSSSGLRLLGTAIAEPWLIKRSRRRSMHRDCGIIGKPGAASPARGGGGAEGSIQQRRRQPRCLRLRRCDGPEAEPQLRHGRPERRLGGSPQRRLPPGAARRGTGWRRGADHIAEQRASQPQRHAPARPCGRYDGQPRLDHGPDTLVHGCGRSR